SSPHFQLGQVADRKRSKKGSLGKTGVGIAAVMNRPAQNQPSCALSCGEVRGVLDKFLII
ncbi:MAG: hypothetical protein KAQ73_05680, partial [Dehalococcoidia bacterium]|nr:hypothetical protein [Dehalococcoidia bacterium]